MCLSVCLCVCLSVCHSGRPAYERSSSLWLGSWKACLRIKLLHRCSVHAARCLSRGRLLVWGWRSLLLGRPENFRQFPNIFKPYRGFLDNSASNLVLVPDFLKTIFGPKQFTKNFKAKSGASCFEKKCELCKTFCRKFQR